MDGSGAATPQGLQIPPLRPSVGMTKDRVVTSRNVRDLDGRIRRGYSARTADLSTALLRSSGRDDKGEGGASIECGCRTEPIFHHLGWAEGYNFSRRNDKGRAVTIRKDDDWMD